MAERIADNADLAVDELKRKARRRLVGAIVLALAAAVILPLLLEKEPRPLGEEVAVQIPAVDDGKFVNRLTAGDKAKEPRAPAKAEATKGAKPEPAKTEVPKAEPSRAEPSKADVAKAEPSKPDAAKAAVPATQPPAPAIAGAPVATPGATPAPAATPVAPASVAAAPATAPRKSISEAEQRVLAPTAKPAPKPDAAPAVKPVPPLEAKVAAAPAPGADAKPVVAPAPAEAKPAAAPAATKAEPKADAAKAAPPADGFVVQLAAFADDKGANAYSAKLRKAGYAAYVEPVQTSRGQLWRVRVGGYPVRADAEAARAKLKDEGYAGIVAAAK
jgi:DedD protein